MGAEGDAAGGSSHLGVDGSRGIVACALTEPTADDAMTGISLVDEVDGHLTRVTADPALEFSRAVVSVHPVAYNRSASRVSNAGELLYFGIVVW